MKDEESKVEEIEVSHTLGGSGEVSRGEGREEGSYSVVIHTEIHQSRGHRHNITGWVVITDTPVYMCDRGVGGRGGYGLRRLIS